MKLLAITTSGPIASAALLQDDGLVCQSLGEQGRTHSETLMPLVEKLLHAKGLTVRDMDAFAVDVGPGSFTGVRIGVCAANAMAFAHGKLVIPVNSLRALRENVPQEPLVCTLLDARNGNGYAAVFGLEPKLAEPQAVQMEPYLSTLPENVLFVGDGARIHENLIRERVKGARFCADAEMLLAKNVGHAAWERYLDGETVQEARPLYLRPSQAERMYQQRHGN